MRRSGFALIEVLMVIGIIGIVSSMSVPVYRDYQIRSDLNLATEQVTQGLARARLLAQSGQEDSGWGFYIPAGILYKGDSYENRDSSFDEVYPMPSTISPSGLLEVSYSKINGRPSDTGEITLTALNKERRNVLITVELESVAVVQNDEFSICHYPPGNPGNAHTITVTDASWPAHRDNHGDTLGPCAGGQSSSSSVAQSSVASSSSAGGGASSSVGGSGEGSCQDRFSVAADGTITTTGPLSVQFQALGAQFGYGNGGPDVPVKVAFRKKNSGGWTNLFGGDEINGVGGDSQTVSGFKNGDKVIMKMRGYYKKKGWLTYDNTIYSNDGSKSIMVLRNGDDAPTIQGASGQASVSELLAPVTTNGKISVGQYDVVLIGDFNRMDCNSCSNNYCSNCMGVDYQDGVVLVKFLQPSC